MKKVAELLSELKNWNVKVSVFWGRMSLSGGDARARKYYGEMMSSHSLIEAHLILELARNDRDLMEKIEERAAIREAEGLSGDLFSAILCNITH